MAFKKDNTKLLFYFVSKFGSIISLWVLTAFQNKVPQPGSVPGQPNLKTKGEWGMENVTQENATAYFP